MNDAAAAAAAVIQYNWAASISAARRHPFTADSTQ